ncbi:response regulator [Thalassotalea sp. PLHSN55]|uniref:response regulator n=1 Tax=Thalassotalea sp. PLHSN55 TaxID=3435888 RepID=UPI003F86264F
MNILIIDDHPLFIDGISQLLKQLAEKVVLHSATSAICALEQLSSGIDFDIVILDLNMPNIDGLSLLQRFHADDLCIPVIIVSSEEQVGLIQQALNWGAMGFIPKSFTTEQILNGVKTVLEGEIYIPSNIQQLLSRQVARDAATHTQSAINKSGLSHKQFEILVLLAKGFSNKKIATILHRTEHTVKSHIAAIFNVLGAENRTECVTIAKKRGLVD